MQTILIVTVVVTTIIVALDFIETDKLIKGK